MADTLSKSKFRLKDLPASERPQERLESLGARALSDRELLAMLLRSGTSKCDVLNLASLMIEKLDRLLVWLDGTFQTFSSCLALAVSKHHNFLFTWKLLTEYHRETG